MRRGGLRASCEGFEQWVLQRNAVRESRIIHRTEWGSLKTYSHFDDPRATDPLDVPSSSYMPPSDAALIRYVERYWIEFRSVVEQYFGSLASALPLYSNYPYATTIVRIYPQGVLTLQNPAPEASVSILRAEDFRPPLESLSFQAIKERLTGTIWTPATLWTWDLRFRAYTDEEAQRWGTLNARIQALEVFWQSIKPSSFEDLCRDLAVAEGLCHPLVVPKERAVDAIDFEGKVYFDEPGRTIREEVWGFQLLHDDIRRPSASVLDKAEGRMMSLAVDVLCIVSFGELTSVGHKVAFETPHIRVWDRTVLNHLLHRHPEIMGQYFRPYAEALERIESKRNPNRSAEILYRAMLQACPSGQADFRSYEEIGLEILRYLFPNALGVPHVQSPTADGVERRDVILRNNRSSRFFQRVAERYDADFVICDFKNYQEPVSGTEINDVATYTNPTLGNFIILISRRGGNDSARAAQLRRLRVDQKMILVVSDEQLLEMVHRKESGNLPEDVLEDLFDELSRKA